VSTEPKTTGPAEALTVPAIENEIPTYRAISAQAVLALMCGVLAIFSFAHPAFLGCAVLAVVLGALADRKIVRMSDVLTGRGLAQAAIALGLTFGLASVTIATVQDWIVVREATKFAHTYEQTLAKGAMEDAIWYGQPPVYRNSKTPQEMYTEMKKARGGMLELNQTGLIKLRAAIDAGAQPHFDRIEQHGDDQRDVFAAALYELHAGKAKPLADEDRFALALLKGSIRNRKYEWWVDQVVYPYTLASYKPKAQPVDEHGHQHEH
jgi:hypothetical protein